MASKRRLPVDYNAIKKSRAGYTGALTKVKDKLRGEESNHPLSYNVKVIQRATSSITNTETGFLQTMDDAQEILTEEEIEDFAGDEQLALDNFMAALNEVQDLAEEMLAKKSISEGLENLKSDIQALRDTFTEQPELNQDSAIQDLKASLSTIRRAMEQSTIPLAHQLRADLKTFSHNINQLCAEVATNHVRLAPPPTVLSTSMSSRDSESEDTCRLPKLDIPTFHGDLMKWSSFWTQFEATVDSNTKLSDVRKMAYLRKAIKDPEATELLNTGTEKPGLYQEKVAELKRRFNRVREIHRNYCKKLTQLGDVKFNRTDLRRLVDTARSAISSLKHSGQYDLDAFLTSIISMVLPIKLQTLWEQHSKKDKGVPPVCDLLEFVSDHAETLPATPPNSGRAPEPQEKNPTRKQDKRPDSTPHRQRTNVHVSTPTPTYKWECVFCKPDRHPLFLCTKWQSMTVAQRLNPRACARTVWLWATTLLTTGVPTDAETVVNPITHPSIRSNLPLLSTPPRQCPIRCQTP